MESYFVCSHCKNQNTSICVYECNDDYSHFEEIDCDFACRACAAYPCNLVEEENSQG